MPIAKTMEFCVDLCIQGYHVYKEIWTAVVGEELNTEREIGNIVDRYAVAMKKDSGETVAHLPKKISRMCSMFIPEGGKILCIVIGNRRYSSNLVQGGLEIPCTLLFRGEEKYIQKLKKLIYIKNKLKCKVIVKQN